MFSPTVQLSGSTLQLNGKGTRHRAVFKVYEMALYLPRKTKSADEVLSQVGPKQIDFTAMRELDTTEVGLALVKGMRANATPEQTRKYLLASNQLIDIMTILIGITVGASTQASVFLTPKTLGIFVLGACSFFIATMGGVLFVKLMNLFLKEGNKINPLIGNAGVSAVPAAARVSQDMGIRYDRSNYLLMHAMGPNVAGVVGSAVAAGILLSFLG